HARRGKGNRGNRNGQLAFALLSFGVDLHLPAAAHHDPKIPAEYLGIGAGALRHIRRGRELRSPAGETQRKNLDLAYIVADATHLDLRHSGNHGWRPDSDQQVIRPGIAVKIDIGTANMGQAHGWEEKEG